MGWKFHRFFNSKIYLHNKIYQYLVQQITEYSKEIYLIHYSKNLSQNPGKNISSWSHDLVHSALHTVQPCCLNEISYQYSDISLIKCNSNIYKYKIHYTETVLKLLQNLI